MAIFQAMTSSFKSDILSAGHNFGTVNIIRAANTPDIFKLALYSAITAALDATTTAYTAVGEITGAGYVAGGQVLTITQVPATSGTPATTAFLNFGNTSWAGASFSTDGALIYNSSNANKSVAVLNFGGTKSVAGGIFTIQFPTPGLGNSIIQIA